MTKVQYLGLFEVRSFSGHHFCQKLVLQTVAGDGEVDERGLCLHLGLVVRIGKFGLNDHPEARVVLRFLVPNLDVAAFLDGQPTEKVVQNGIDVLTDVFQ